MNQCVIKGKGKSLQCRLAAGVWKECDRRWNRYSPDIHPTLYIYLVYANHHQAGNRGSFWPILVQMRTLSGTLPNLNSFKGHISLCLCTFQWCTFRICHMCRYSNGKCCVSSIAHFIRYFHRQKRPDESIYLLLLQRRYTTKR